jgi:hypothetical protein
MIVGDCKSFLLKAIKSDDGRRGYGDLKEEKA